MRGKIGDVFWRWADLDAFTQGYIEALFAGLQDASLGFPILRAPAGGFRHVAFSDLAPETLARIIADCATADHLRPGVDGDSDALSGRHLWELRQAGKLDRFPPLTPTLGDDGKVYLAEVQS